MDTTEKLVMSRKETPRPGILRARVAGHITNRQAAGALAVTIRHVQRLSRRYREGGLAEFLCRLAGVTPRRDLFDLSQDEADDEVEHIKVPSGPLPPEVRRALFGEKSNS